MEIFDRFMMSEKGPVGCAIVLVVALFAVVAIGIYQHAAGIKAGYVYDKDYSGPSDTVTCTSGKVTVCTPRHDNAKFTLWIRDGKRTNWFEVPATVWEQATLGRWFDSVCYCFQEK